jgi:hypothetical protein
MLLAGEALFLGQLALAQWSLIVASHVGNQFLDLILDGCLVAVEALDLGFGVIVGLQSGFRPRFIVGYHEVAHIGAETRLLVVDQEAGCDCPKHD